jgi:hypothetical protein
MSGTRHAKHVPQKMTPSPEADPAARGGALFDDSRGLISFGPPSDPTPDEQKLVSELVILDHLKQNQLKERGREWDQVHKLLLNVVVLLHLRDAAGARAVLDEARQVYLKHNQAQNRIRYLMGAVAGTVVAAVLGAVLFLLATRLAISQSRPLIEPQLLVLILIFAGIGSTTSILTRLAKIDLRDETSSFSVYVSGFSRPFVAVSFAVVVYFILDTKIVDITIGKATGDHAAGLYVVTSFLCGFSERFGKDIIARISSDEAEGEAKSS